ncbi:unnamed protein product [Pneumocystis jirovecii]|uniref:Autophagy-related protein 18 n=1 Tax=Pneumocystis jirovecii TaxID=42068 RepID=L0P848_PNEJI|nr:unnamed protein product [Pneumocystis jirovecii]
MDIEFIHVILLENATVNVVDGGIGIMEMLFCTSLVALVGMGGHPSMSPRRLQIFNTKRQSIICELTFPTLVLSIKLNRRRLIVVLEEQIYIYDISNMKLLHTIETSPNPSAVCSLSYSSENCYIAYPLPNLLSSGLHTSTYRLKMSHSKSSVLSGDVLLFDALTLQPINIVKAHKSPLAFISLNNSGTLLATSSDRGTVIRIFSIPCGTKLYEFRRGTSLAKIYSINFSLTSNFLCVTSNTETVHIYKLFPDEINKGKRSYNMPSLSKSCESLEKKRSIIKRSFRRSSYFIRRNFITTIENYLPTTLTEIWEPTRNFAYAKIPGHQTKNIAAFNSSSQLMVITSEGQLYYYDISLENGGECVLLKQYSLLNLSEETD